MDGTRHLILDLDGTILHPEWQPTAVEVPGRTRSTFLSLAVRDALLGLTSLFRVIIATGRSWAATEAVHNALVFHGIPVAGVVVEEGALVGVPGHFRRLPNEERNAVALTAAREVLDGPSLPESELQHDFQACVVARTEDRETARVLAKELRARIARNGRGLRCHRDGRKVYLLESGVNKWTGLERLLGPAAQRATGIGDGPNDVCWLSRIDLPCAPRGAVPEVLDAVASARGLISSQDGHAGIRQLLELLAVRSEEERSGT